MSNSFVAATDMRKRKRKELLSDGWAVRATVPSLESGTLTPAGERRPLSLQDK